MTRFPRLNLLTIAFGALLAGCPGAPAPDGGVEFAVTDSDPPGYGWDVPCFDPDTGEFTLNCLDSNIDEVIATLKLDSDRDGMTDVDEVARGKNPRYRFDGPDIDGDGTLNGDDPDVDGDGQPNGSDFDIDGDDQPNGQDDDADADDRRGGDDPDEDGDDISDRFDLNDDGDGLFDDEDDDDDGDGDKDDDDANKDDGDDDDDDDDDKKPPTLDDLVERLRDGNLMDADRARIAKEIADRLGDPQKRDEVLRAIQNLGTRAGEGMRDPGLPAVPPQIGAIDALYRQLGRSLDMARRDANIMPGKPLTEDALREALKDFVPRAQAMDELSKSFQTQSIRELGLAVTDLHAALGNAERVRDFAEALNQSISNNPLTGPEGPQLDKLITGAALLGQTFDMDGGGDLLNAIRKIDGLVDTPEQLSEALRDLRDLGQQGNSLDDAVAEMEERLGGEEDEDEDE